MNPIIQNIEKVVINVGIGRLQQQAQFKEKILPELEKEISAIAGQKSSARPARKSIAGFKTREGDTVGLKVTLRGKRMGDFLIRLNNIVLPRVRDFKGIDPKVIDEGGNLNIPFREQFAFPEIDPNTSKVNFGFQVTVVPKKKDRESAIETYKSIGIPLKK